MMPKPNPTVNDGKHFEDRQESSNQQRNAHTFHTGTGRGQNRKKNGPRNGGARGPQSRIDTPGMSRLERAEQMKHAMTDTKKLEKKFEKMLESANANFSDIRIDGGKTEDCTICCKPSDLFGLGECRHPVCIECCVRMRVLSERTTCPTCRSEIPTLYFIYASSNLPEFDFSSLSELRVGSHLDEKRFGIRFENQKARERYDLYLAHICRRCIVDGEPLKLPSFAALRQHMIGRHNLSFCEICTENLALFSRERRTYTREELQRHLKYGDSDDRSQKGHPTCLFCSGRHFFDEENRYRHLRKEHFYCQFCDANGISNVFYAKHEELVAHYQKEHFVCDAEECRAMGIAFSSALDLKIHQTREHTIRQALPLDFHFSDRVVGAQANRGPPPQRGRAERPTRITVTPAAPEPERQRQDTEYVVVPSAQHAVHNNQRRLVRNNFAFAGDEFPTLCLGGQGSQPAPVLTPNDFPRLGNKKKKTTTKASPNPEDEFPSLGGSQPQPKPPAPTVASSVTPVESSMVDDDEMFPSFSGIVRASNPAKAEQKAKPLPTVHHSADAFPALASSAGAQRPKGPTWSKRVAQSNGVVTGCVVPASYNPRAPREARLPVPDIWPDLNLKPVDSFDEKAPEVNTSMPESLNDLGRVLEGKENKGTAAAAKGAQKTTTDKKEMGCEEEEKRRMKEEQKKEKTRKAEEERQRKAQREKERQAAQQIDEKLKEVAEKQKQIEAEKERLRLQQEEINRQRERDAEKSRQALQAVHAQMDESRAQSLHGEAANSRPSQTGSFFLNSLLSNPLASLFGAAKESQTSSSTGKQLNGSVIGETSEHLLLSAPPGFGDPKEIVAAPPPGFGPPPGFDKTLPKTDSNSNDFASAPMLSSADIERKKQEKLAAEKSKSKVEGANVDGWQTAANKKGALNKSAPVKAKK